MNFKYIHIGQMIEKRVAESGIAMSRICNFFNCNENEITEMYTFKSLDTETLLKWSKLLEYDFFRVYSQHLILYSPPSANTETTNYHKGKSQLPRFRKNIYTKEIIDFILEEIESGNMSKTQVIECYKIPKTTLYKWISKYKK